MNLDDIFEINQFPDTNKFIPVNQYQDNSFFVLNTDSKIQDTDERSKLVVNKQNEIIGRTLNNGLIGFFEKKDKNTFFSIYGKEITLATENGKVTDFPNDIAIKYAINPDDALNSMFYQYHLELAADKVLEIKEFIEYERIQSLRELLDKASDQQRKEWTTLFIDYGNAYKLIQELFV